MRRKPAAPLYICGIVFLIAGGIVAIAAAGDGEEQIEVRIIKSLSECATDDCEEYEGLHKKIIIKCLGDGCDENELNKHHFNFDFLGLHSARGGFLGVELNELSSELREHFGVPGDVGVMVSKVLPDSPADKAGVQVGDIISGVDNEDIKSGRALAREIRSREEGETVDLEVWRDGKLEKLTAGIEKRDTSLLHPRAFAFHTRHGARKNIKIRHLLADDGDFDFDCDGSDDCTIIVKCHDGTCDCTVNGDTADCADIPGVPHQKD
ncbi:MAG: PDZ domain-containing protein [Thermoanaerobaculia bacterium]